MNIRKYVSDPVFCPKCESGDIDGGPYDSSYAMVYQPVHCNDCGHEWEDRYELVGVDDEFAYYQFSVREEFGEPKRHSALLCMEDKVTLEILGKTFYITVADGHPVILEDE